MEGIKQLQTLDYAVIAGYFVIIIAAGSYFSRYIKQARDYFTAGAEMSWWFGGISLWMATFSALGFVVYAEIGYKFGFTIITLYCLGIPAKIIGGMFFAKRWRRARSSIPALRSVSSQPSTPASSNIASATGQKLPSLE